MFESPPFPLSDDWRAAVRARAAQPPLLPRRPLRLASGGAVIGSLETALAKHMRDEGLPMSESTSGWHLDGPPDAALAILARWLDAQGLGGRWRDELLPVTDDAGSTLAVVERAAVRPLGITTHAVHLVGHVADGCVWVQQRALDKATDPGLWDTLMGGLISAAESPDQTLARETWEEAGLRMQQLRKLRPFGELWVRRPVSEGYMVERIHMVEAEVPDGVVPVNQDGEVARFECVDLDTLGRRLRQDRFTLEAALILLHWLEAGGPGREAGAH